MAGEIHLGTRIIARAFDGQHFAFAELVVKHLLASLQAVRGVGFLGRDRRTPEAVGVCAKTAAAPGRLRHATRNAPVPGAQAGSKSLVLWRDPLQRRLGQFVEKTAT